MAFRRALCSALALLGALGLVLGIPLAASADDTIAFTIRDSRITESSGLARDPGADGYWTVNDSGDTGIAYGVSTTGEITGTLEYRADPVDVEAVAMHKGRLYVADIGDNGAERERITVYYFDNAQANDQTVGLPLLGVPLPRRRPRRRDPAGQQRRPALHRHQGRSRRGVRGPASRRSGPRSTSWSGWATPRPR